MSRPSETACLVSTYISDSACFKAMTPHDQKALILYLKVKELAALGGTDYTRELGNGGSLVTAAACVKNQLLNNFGPLGMNMALFSINQDNANSSGAAISTDIQTLATEIECLKDFDPTTLDAMDIVITCLLGRHAAWPQVDL